MRANENEFAIYHNTGILLMNGNTVLNAGNYTTYTVPKTGGTFSGNVTAPTFIGNLTGTADKSTYSDILITKTINFTAANDRLNVKSGVRFYANIYNNSGIAGDWGFPSVTNSNGVLVLQTDTVDSEPLNGRTSHVLGLSSNGNIYHKYKNNDSTSWYEIVEAKGTSTQFIKGDGTFDSTEYATKEDVEDSGTYWEYL